MNCKELNKSVIKFIEKELIPEKENEFKEHLNECSECSIMFFRVKETYSIIDINQEIEPRAFFTESILNRIDNGKVKESVFDVTVEIAISALFKKFAYTSAAFILVLFMILYSTGNLSVFSNSSEDDDFSTNKVSSAFFENQ